jgi:hypothetical protein
MSHIPCGLTLLILALSLIPAAIYLDATGHGIGKIRGVGNSMSAAGWALWALLPGVGTLGVIAYLTNRRDMIERAGIHPVIVPECRRLYNYFLILAASTIVTTFWWLAVRLECF